MFHAPTSENKQPGDPTHAKPSPEKAREVHPYSGAVPARTAKRAATLQRSIGNQAVLRLLDQQGRNQQPAGQGAAVRSNLPQAQTRLTAPPGALQAKLMIGPANDPLEQEADRVAEQVMRMPEPNFTPLAHSHTGDNLQKQDDKTATATEEQKTNNSKLSLQLTQPDFLSLRRPFFERNVLHLWDMDSALGVWKYNFDFFKRLGVSDNWAGKVANLTAPFAIDAQLKADNPKWWEITDRDLNTTSIMGSIPLFDFDAGFKSWRPLPFLQKKALEFSSEKVQRKCVGCEEDKQL